MSIIVTGGAGFIGSCIVKVLNDNDFEDIIIVDDIATTEKWQNLNGKKYSNYINKNVFFERVNEIRDVTHIIHMGACSSTVEKNFDYIWENNVEFSKRLFLLSVENGLSFIYASSAATYGNGCKGFSDESIQGLTQLNIYGYTKHMFDLWVEKQLLKPKQCVGLKFFNVYGPNEYHKNGMSSMIYQGYKQIIQTGRIQLFKSNIPSIAEGMQKRDFVYVKDICKVVIWLLKNERISGLYNIGTGVARTYNELAEILFSTLKKDINISYIDIPVELKNQYQYYTQASISKLREAGYKEDFSSLENGVTDYINNYLLKDIKFW